MFLETLGEELIVLTLNVLCVVYCFYVTFFVSWTHGLVLVGKVDGGDCARFFVDAL